MPFTYHRFKYPLLVDLVDILFSSVSRAVVLSAEDIGCDPSLGWYNGGRCGILNLKCFFQVYMRLDTSSDKMHRCLKQLSLWMKLEFGRLSNKIRLIAWSLRYYNKSKYPLLVDLVEIIFISVGREVAVGTEGTGTIKQCEIQRI